MDSTLHLKLVSEGGVKGWARVSGSTFEQAGSESKVRFRLRLGFRGSVLALVALWALDRNKSGPCSHLRRGGTGLCRASLMSVPGQAYLRGWQEWAEEDCDDSFNLSRRGCP